MALRNELLTAIAGNDIVTVRQLIKPAEDTATKEAYGDLLLDAVKKDNIEIARLLLEAGAVTSRKTANGNTCYHIALSRQKQLSQNQDMLKCLVSYDTSGFHLTNSDNKTPVEWAIEHECEESLKILFKQPAAKEYYETCSDISSHENYTIGYLHKAIVRQHPKMLDLLLSSGFTPEMTDSLFARMLDKAVGGHQSSQMLSRAITNFNEEKRRKTNTAMNLLAVFVQAQRQDKPDQKPHLGRMSNDTLLHILSFLSDSVQKKQNVMPDMKTFLDRISSECKSRTEQKDKEKGGIFGLLKHGFTAFMTPSDSSKKAKKITLSHCTKESCAKENCTKEKPLRKKPGVSV